MSTRSKHFAGEIPFMPDGSIPNYVDWLVEKNALFKTNTKPFKAKLRFHDFFRGRSSSLFQLEDVVTGAKFFITPSDTLTLMQNADIVDATVEGHWGVKKQGHNYSLFMVEKLPATV